MEEIKVVSGKVEEIMRREGVSKGNFTIVEKETQEFNVENGDFSLFRTLFDNNLSITVYKENKKGSISTNRFDESAIVDAVKGAITSADSAIADEAYDIAPKQDNEVFHRGVYEPDIEKLFERIQELLKDIKERHPKVKLMLQVISYTKYHQIYRNTNETEFEVFGGNYNISLEFSGNDGEKTTSIMECGVSVDSLERPLIELGAIQEELAIAEAQLNTVEFKGKFEGEIILMPGCFGQFFYSIATNFLSDQVLLQKTSIWADKIGQQVADSRVSISFNPSDSRIVSGECFTGDGFRSEDYDVIKDGELKSFMTTLYGANKIGVARAKNSGFSMVMKAGDVSYADMVKNMERGLIVESFSGGQPSSNGDFSGVAKNSFYVENGEIKGAVSETMINGNLAKMLQNIVAISKETLEDGESVIPYVAVNGIVISGKEE